MNPARSVLSAGLTRYLSRLRFPQLFLITGIIFVVNVIVPDLIPFVDEIMLGLLTLLLGSLREKRNTVDAPAK